jgi:single-strand DNA-binding protein
MNLITIAGRLGRDAEHKVLPSGKEVINFAVAVDIGRGDNKTTLWIDCALWGERAAKLQPYLVKGTSVTLAGDFNLRTFQKKDGSAGATITCDVQRLTLQGGREVEQTEAPAPAKPAMTPSTWSAPKQSRPAPPTEQSLNDEIPF